MNNQFDELAKGLAQSVTRRAALKKFGIGLAAFALAAVGLAPSAQAGNRGVGEPCKSDGQCQKGLRCNAGVCATGPCMTDADCPEGMVCYRYPGPFGGFFGYCGAR